MAKTLEFEFWIGDEVVVDGRPAWIDHIQLTKDGRTLFYCSTTEASGKPTANWYQAAQLAAKLAG